MIHLPTILARVWRESAVFRGRYRTGGWPLASAYAQACAANWYIFVRSRFSSEPRVECPCCGWQGFDFLALDCGRYFARHVLCPNCLAQARHRMLHLYLHRCRPEFFSEEGRVLHVAPETQVRDLVMSNSRLLHVMTVYTNCPEQRFPGITLRSDIQHLPIQNEAFDCLFALHMLEHVRDDRAGIREIHRVLRPGGVAYIMVPFEPGYEKTTEFGKPDFDNFGHVRGYHAGDFEERLGVFSVETIRPGAFLGSDEMHRYGIPHDTEILYRCVRRPSTSFAQQKGTTHGTTD